MESVSCLVCGSGKTITLLYGSDRLFPENRGQFRLVRCTVCGFYFQNPRPSSSEIGHFYPKDSYYSYQLITETVRDVDGFFKRIKRKIKDKVITRCFGYPSKKKCSTKIFILDCFEWPTLFRQAVKEKIFSYKPLVPYCTNGRMLEIGCGAGTTLAWYKDHGWETWGLEISQYAAENARRMKVTVNTGDIGEAGFADDYFDAILLFDTIEHMHNLRATLKEIRRILKPTGSVYITTQNIASLEMRLFKSNWPALDLPRHLYDFDQQALNRLLRQEKFTIAKSSFTVAPGSIFDCMQYLRNDFVCRRKSFRVKFLTMVIFVCRAVFPVLVTFIRILPWFGISGGLCVVAKKVRKNSVHQKL